MGVSAAGLFAGCGLFRRFALRTAVLIPAAGLIISIAGGLMVHIPERNVLRLLGLFMVYLGGSILLLTACSFQTCLALLVCGIGTSVLLGTGGIGRMNQRNENGPAREKRLFRVILTLMLAMVSYTLSERIRYWIPVRRTVLFVCVWTSLMSLIDLAMEDDLLYRCIYLQCICLSFTVVYIYMESSMLVFACFAAINLLMAFGGSILAAARYPGNDSERIIS